MSPGAIRRDESGWYEIRLRGRLDPRWSAWLDGVHVTTGNDGITVLTGHITDQSALHGLLARVRDIGLHLISVVRIELDSGRRTTHPTNPQNPTGD